MSSPQRSQAPTQFGGVRLVDRDVTELVDALVEAIDVNRWPEIDRLRSALEPFGAVVLFDAELRLNGVASIDEGCICFGVEVAF